MVKVKLRDYTLQKGSLKIKAIMMFYVETLNLLRRE